jgi:hypothetical protein
MSKKLYRYTTAMRTNQTQLAMRLCRDYEPQGVIPMQAGSGLESWLEAGGGSEKEGEEQSGEELSGKAGLYTLS